MTVPKPRADGAGQRKTLPPAMLAALWTVSNGQCYAPGCPMPVVLETRPGVYKKNSQVAHIYGVKPGAARYRPDMDASERDSFANLLLLCLAHHEEVDDDEDLYPSETLKKWKADHEGDAHSTLNRLVSINPDALLKYLTKIAEPPLNRLEAITRRLEETGDVTADTVNELKQITAAMSATTAGIDAHAVLSLSYAAEVLGTRSFSSTARDLAHAAETLPRIVREMSKTAATMSLFHPGLDVLVRKECRSQTGSGRRVGVRTWR
ncbi:hypothetical protein, partial [Actinosynnema sp. NPDC023587]|uniref:hypothetical protein n=1 Tax=Actinosynnema sp. NPDC023587 TaxID=3154695 RepID=UPI0033DC82D3